TVHDDAYWAWVSGPWRGDLDRLDPVEEVPHDQRAAMRGRRSVAGGQARPVDPSLVAQRRPERRIDAWVHPTQRSPTKPPDDLVLRQSCRLQPGSGHKPQTGDAMDDLVGGLHRPMVPGQCDTARRQTEDPLAN